MGVRTKSRRQLTIGDRPYVWYVKEDEDSLDYILHVLSKDKQFIVHYRLAQPFERLYLTVLGREFGRVDGTGGVWRRFRCPRWENDVVTPAVVRSLIEWCNTTSDETVEVDYSGRAVPVGGLCPSCGVDVRGMIPLDSNCCHRCGRDIRGKAG
ncbi:MAG: hypothetical protein JWM11_1899 [Planctomycetaceae bacterium]|nr:hypothetical protein [Planctomycetaceae bacterium]